MFSKTVHTQRQIADIAAWEEWHYDQKACADRVKKVDRLAARAATKQYKGMDRERNQSEKAMARALRLQVGCGLASTANSHCPSVAR